MLKIFPKNKRNTGGSQDLIKSSEASKIVSNFSKLRQKGLSRFFQIFLKKKNSEAPKIVSNSSKLKHQNWQNIFQTSPKKTPEALKII